MIQFRVVSTFSLEELHKHFGCSRFRIYSDITKSEKNGNLTIGSTLSPTMGGVVTIP